MKIQRIVWTLAAAFQFLLFWFLVLNSQSEATSMALAHPQAIIRYVATSGNNSGDCTNTLAPCKSVQYAVEQSAGNDEIRIAAGSYSDVYTRAYSSYDINYIITQVVYITQSLTIRGGFTLTNWSEADPLANPTILDAGGLGRVFYVTDTHSLTIEGIGITGGRAENVPGEYSGGGLYVVSTTVVLQDISIFSNTAYYHGGGLFIEYGSVSLENCKVFSNTAFQDGGGIYLYTEEGSFNLESSRVYSNTASEHGGGIYLHTDKTAYFSGTVIEKNIARTGWGGGVFLSSSDRITIRDSIFQQNTATNNAGLSVSADYGEIGGNTFQFNHAEEYGGGVSMYGEILFYENQVISNTAKWGAGQYIQDGEIIIQNNDYIDNVASEFGGGMYYRDSNITLKDNFFTANEAGQGGGIAGGAYNYTVLLEQNMIISNTASSNGGGIAIYSGAVILDGNLIKSNTAGQAGGGVFFKGYSGEVSIINNIVTDNSAVLAGSGIAIADSSATLMHNTIINNTGGGGGVHLRVDNTVYCIVQFKNNILAGHTLGLFIDETYRADVDGMLWGSGAWANGQDWAGDGIYNPGEGNLWADPLFVDPQNGDFHLQFGSPAIDAGTDSGVALDFDREARPNRWGYDIGADEYVDQRLRVTKQAHAELVPMGGQITYTIRLTNTSLMDLHPTITDVLPGEVTPTGLFTWTPGILAPGQVWTQTLVVKADQDFVGNLENRVWVTTEEGPSGVAKSLVETYDPERNCQAKINNASYVFSTLQDAVNASADPTDVIKVFGYCGGVTQRGGLPQTVYISKTLTLQGGWDKTFTQRDLAAHPTTLDAQGAGRVIYVTGDITATIDGFEITGGDNRLTGEEYARGGGIKIQSANAILTHNRIYHNFSEGCGGGVSINLGQLRMSNNDIEMNTSVICGGGLIIGSYSVAQVSDNLIANNVSFDTHQSPGGGIYVTESTISLLRNTIVENTSGSGGGVYVDRIVGQTLISGNNIQSNHAYADGGGAYLGDLPLINGPQSYVVSHNTFQDNSALENGGGLFLKSALQTTLAQNSLMENHANLGGGIFLYGSNYASTEPKINSNLIYSNTAESYGGGIYSRSTGPVFTSNVIARNQAQLGGGGVYIRSMSYTPYQIPTFYQTTFSQNKSPNGAGIYLAKVDYYPNKVILYNSIIVSHTTGIYAEMGTNASLEATLWGGGGWANTMDWTGGGNVLSGTINLWDDPGFLEPVDAYYHLGPSSPAINAGIDTGAQFDIDNQPSPMGSAYELGADEYWEPTLHLRKLAQPDPVLSGWPITYTIIVTNINTVEASVLVTDILPAMIQPTDILTWTPQIAANGVWSQTFIAFVDSNYTGIVTNTVTASASFDQRSASVGVMVVEPKKIYLPLIAK